MKWTKMQEKAVFHPLSDILVTAAAGSGKTQVLTGRILDRIKSKKTDISKERKRLWASVKRITQPWRGFF